MRGVVDTNVFVSAAFHGGVLRITQKGLHVRTTIATTHFHRFPID